MSNLKSGGKCISAFNQHKQNIMSIFDELIFNDLESIKVFPIISRKLLAEIGENKKNFESVFFVFKWSDTLSLIEQKEFSRKIYALIATLHLMKILEQKHLLSTDTLNVIASSLKSLHQNVFNSILDNIKLHIDDEDQIISFSHNLLDEFNQIGNGEYCNIIFSSLLMKIVLSIPDEYSDKFCQHLCVSTNEKNRMKKANIDPITILNKIL